MEKTVLHKEIDIKYDIDVAVVGGGTAGVFAAISAAKCGAEVVLIEKNGILGGTMTVGGINFPGLFFAWGRKIIDGPCWESIERTVALGGAKLPKIVKKPERHWHEQIRLNKAVYAHVLDQMCDAAGVRTLFYSMAADVCESENDVVITICGKEGLSAVRAKCVIDATGDADIVNMLGYDTLISDIQQPATPTNKLAGYDFNALDEPAVKRAVSQGIEAGELPAELTPDKVCAYLFKYNLDIHIPCKNCADSETKGEIEKRARKKIIDIIGFLKRIPGLENLYAEELCNECGIRETRRIVGEQTVTAEDYISARRFDDAVCYAFYPVDLHVMEGIDQKFLKEDTVPTIPYKALIPKNSKRLLVCGRCVSSDNLANSALRVQAPCMAMGQAAGCAAAIAAKKNTAPVLTDYNELCEKLRGIGAIVPSDELF